MIISLYKLLLKKNKVNGLSKESNSFISNCEQGPNILPILLENNSILGVAPRLSGRRRCGPFSSSSDYAFMLLENGKRKLKEVYILNPNMLLTFQSKKTARTM